MNVALTGEGALRKDGGFWIATLPGAAKPRLFISRTDAASLDALANTFNAPLDLAPLTQGGPRQWSAEVTTTSEAGKAGGAFIADTFPLPVENPWQSWMRPGGFDFTPDGKAAVVAMWNGDVWRVDGPVCHRRTEAGRAGDLRFARGNLGTTTLALSTKTSIQKMKHFLVLIGLQKLRELARVMRLQPKTRAVISEFLCA